MNTESAMIRLFSELRLVLHVVEAAQERIHQLPPSKIHTCLSVRVRLRGRGGPRTLPRLSLSADVCCSLFSRSRHREHCDALAHRTAANSELTVALARSVPHAHP